MIITEYLKKEAVLPHLQAITRKDVMAEMVLPLIHLQPILANYDVVSALCEREGLGTTAVGEGVAIPHCKVPVASNLTLAVGKSTVGVDFDAPDKELCHIFFLILAPENMAGQHLRLLAHIARRVKDSVFRSEILLSQSREQMWQTVIAP